MGIKFADPAEVKYRVATANATNAMFEIPAGDPAYQVESTRTYGRDVLLLSVFPHMHLRGKDFHYEVIYPDGRKETLLNMPRYDFNWQTSYVFDEPKKLPAGHDAALHGALRQLGRQSGQSRSDQAGPLGRSDLGRNDDRLVRHRRAQGHRYQGRAAAAGRPTATPAAAPAGRRRRVANAILPSTRDSAATGPFRAL